MYGAGGQKVSVLISFGYALSEETCLQNLALQKLEGSCVSSKGVDGHANRMFDWFEL